MSDTNQVKKHIINGWEIEAREILTTPVYLNITQSTVANVFRAMWHISMPIDQVQAIAEAMYRTTFHRDDIQRAVNYMISINVLRRVNQRGVPRYEVNLKGE